MDTEVIEVAKFEYGSEIICVDFHLHTRRDKEFTYSGEEDRFVSDYIDALNAKDISVGVITNHNKFDVNEYKALRSKGRKHDICILPGVELSVKEGGNGLHVLIVFNPDEWIENDDINNFLAGAFTGISNRENANTSCNYDLPSTLKKLEECGKDYFVIFAHIEQDKGLLKECKGGLITSLAQNEFFSRRVLGVQKLRTRDHIPNLHQWLGYEIAFVEGSDPKNINDIGKDGCQSYIKVGEASFDAIKYALIDHENRFFNANERSSHSYIKSMKFTGGKFGGVTLNLSHQLNTLIGIRGSGKSSVLEVLRWGLNIKPFVDDKYKEELVKNILGSGGQLSMVVADEHGREFEVRRILGENSSVLDMSGNDIAVSIQSLIKNPLYFGQKDLAFSKPGYEFELLNKLVGNKIAMHETNLAAHIETLCVLIGNLLSISKLPEMIKDLEEKNRDLEHRMKIFEEKGIASKLEKQTAHNADILKLNSIVANARDMAKSIITNIRSCDLNSISFEGYESKYNQELIGSVSAVISQFIDKITRISQIALELQTDVQSLTTLENTLFDCVEQLKEEFAQIKREINDDTLDPDSFLNYKRDHDKNKELIERHKKTLESLTSIKDSIKSEIRKRNELLQSIFTAYNNEIGKINDRQEALQLSIEFKGNKAQFLEDLKVNFRGTGISETKYKSLSESFSDYVAILDDYFLNSGKKLKSIISEGEFSKVGEKIEKSYKDMAETICPDIVEIKYHGKPLKRHSIGQRASALILFILEQQQHDVIIIDQPEDDLDNQVVYSEFISTLKAKKSNIQFVFATHNANIPVLGDAERVISTECVDESFTLSAGNIDTPTSHKQIVEIMEGGYDAFNRRNAIYSSWANAAR